MDQRFFPSEPEPHWLEEKEQARGPVFTHNGSRDWKTWSGQHTFTAIGERRELCRIECPNPRLCFVTVNVESDPAVASTIALNADQGSGTCTVPFRVLVTKLIATGAANAIAQVHGRIIIVTATLTTAPPADGVLVSAIITPFFPWY